MATRSSSLRTCSAQTPRRAPLKEAHMVPNQKEGLIGKDTDVRESKSIGLPRSLSQSAAASPARRVRNAIASPAKRTLRSRRSLSPEQSLEVQVVSPVKRNLGSPMRKLPSTRSLPMPDLGLPQAFASSTVLEARSTRETHSDVLLESGSTKLVEVHISTAQTLSPLKRPARRPEVPIEKSEVRCFEPARDVLSPLKRPPSRVRATFARSMVPTKTTILQLDLSSSIDELSLPSVPNTPSQIRPKKNPRTSSGSKKRTSGLKSVRKSPTTPTHDFGQDELAVAAYTPIQTPCIATHAQSPPSEETMFDDDDLWTPSVPLTLSKSFSELSLYNQDESMTPTKQPEHTFFDNEGQVIPDSQAHPTSATRECRSSHSTDAVPDFKIYVDCKSTDLSDSSEYFSSVLTELGAKILCRWNWNPETQTTPNRQPRVGLTHVVFFGGAIRTLKKVKQARKLGIEVKCVGLSWVMQCKKSGRLTIGTEGHEVDVEAELNKLNYSRRKSMEPVALVTPVKVTKGSSALDPVDFLAPVDFGDEPDDISAIASTAVKSSLRKPSTTVAKSVEIIVSTNEFELKQLALARRNSAKFRPPISSPLSKKAWRA